MKKTYVSSSVPLEVLNKEALAGNPKAQYRLGLIYYYGEGVEQSYKEAVFWHRKAAEKEYLKAFISLSRMYKKGRGVQQDAAESTYWGLKAAEAGDPESQSMIGTHYLKGEGVPEDAVRGYAWLRVAILNGRNNFWPRLGCLITKWTLNTSQLKAAEVLIHELRQQPGK